MKSTIPKDFDTLCRKEEDILIATTDMYTIIKRSLELAEGLRNITTLAEYNSNYSSFLTYLRVFHRKISRADQYPQDILQKAYNTAISYKHVLPRLYICMVIASLIKDTSYLASLCSMFASESQPLQGLMLRFTAISFFPRNSPLLVQFCVTNFNEMLYLTTGFLELFPGEVITAAEWIASNISISFTMVNDSILINHYIETAISCGIKEIGDSSIEAIVYSIQPNTFKQYIAGLKNYFTSTSVSEITSKSVYYIVKNVDSAKTAFEFVKGTDYEELFVYDIATRCIEESDDETLKKLPPHEAISQLIITTAGSDKYTKIGKPFPKGSALSIEFATRLTPETKAEVARQFLEKEIENMSFQLYKALKDNIIKNDFPSDYITKFFAPPFVFQTTDLLLFTVNRGFHLGVDRDLLKGYIRISKNLPAPARAAAMALIMSHHELVSYILGLEDHLSKLFLMHKIDDTFPKESIAKILEKCDHIDEYVHLFNASTLFDDISLSEDIFNRLTEKDSIFDSNEDLINFYVVKLINTIYSASEVKLPMTKTQIDKVFQHVANAIKTASENPYPLTTPKKMNHWHKIVAYGLKLEKLDFVHSKIEEICKTMKQMM